MNFFARSAFLLVVFAALAITPQAQAQAQVQADGRDPDATRLASVGHALKWNWVPPGRSERFGHAETLIHSPIADVRRMVLDFAHYKEMAPSISTSRVIGHESDGSTDVYIRMGVLNNMLTFWNITKFSPLRVAPDTGEVVEGRMVPGKGNIADSAAVWTMRAAAPDWTVLKFDVLLRPRLPAPQSLIDEQLRDSAMDAVNSIHDRAQGSPQFLPYSG